MKSIAFLLVALSATAVQAALIHIKPSLVTVFDSQLNDVTSIVLDHNANGKARLRPSAELYTLRIDFSLTIRDLQPDQLGFGNAAFNVILGGALNQAAAAPGWNASTEIVDHDGLTPGGLRDKWADNGDYGIAGDLRGIVVGTDPPDFGPVGVDLRRVLGKYGDEYFGNVLFDLSGTHGTMGSLSVEGDGGSVYNANNKLVDAGVTVTGGSIDFFVGVPEPSSVLLLGLGGLVLMALGRRLVKR
jgi:hypothetical protein